jgi:FKBP-type peptidyl-prolyl cis-trans isomerase FkpA
MHSNSLYSRCILSLALLGSLSCHVAEAAVRPPKVTELIIIDTVVGTGAEAVADVEEGDKLAVNYTGWIYDPTKADRKGRKFDSNADSKRPFVFKLGMKMVITGWDQGLDGMKVGGKRTLIIPPALGYPDGVESKAVSIPENVPLVFDVELLSVTKP